MNLDTPTIPALRAAAVFAAEPDVAQRRRRLFWGLQIGGWLLLMPGVAAVFLFGIPHPLAAMWTGAMRQVIGFGITLGFWCWYRRWPHADFKLVRYAGQIVALCALATVIDALATRLLVHWLDLAPLPLIAQRGSIIVRFAIYATWSALYFTIRAELDAHDHDLRLARAEAAAREAELQMLRTQVDPHFLFNALNTIAAEAEGHQAAMAEIVHAVSDYLRYSLRHGSHRAPLGDELNAVGNYLSVERAHHGADRLDWRIEATDEARMTPAPTALVQPLVENAIKYGLRTSPRPLRLRIDARVEDGELQVAVENSGAWVQRRAGERIRESTGIGLINLRRRLALLCGENARLEVSTAGGTVRIDVRLPAPPPGTGTPPPR